MNSKLQRHERIDFLVATTMTSNLNVRILKLWNPAVCPVFTYFHSITAQSLWREEKREGIGVQCLGFGSYLKSSFIAS